MAVWFNQTDLLEDADEFIVESEPRQSINHRETVIKLYKYNNTKINNVLVVLRSEINCEALSL